MVKKAKWNIDYKNINIILGCYWVDRLDTINKNECDLFDSIKYRRNALSHWSQGFSENTTTSVDDLLDLMCIVKNVVFDFFNKVWSFVKCKKYMKEAASTADETRPM